jgi:hypothetical protein
LIEAVMPPEAQLLGSIDVVYSDRGLPTKRRKFGISAEGLTVTVPETPTGPASNDEIATEVGTAAALGASTTPKPATTAVVTT